MNTNCFSDGGGFTWVWNYRYTPTGERESKRLVTMNLPPIYGQKWGINKIESS